MIALLISLILSTPSWASGVYIDLPPAVGVGATGASGATGVSGASGSTGITGPSGNPVTVQGMGVTPTCGAPQNGLLAVTSAYILCVCNTSAWVKTSDGSTSCTF